MLDRGDLRYSREGVPTTAVLQAAGSPRLCVLSVISWFEGRFCWSARPPADDEGLLALVADSCNSSGWRAPANAMVGRQWSPPPSLPPSTTLPLEMFRAIAVPGIV